MLPTGDVFDGRIGAGAIDVGVSILELQAESASAAINATGTHIRRVEVR
jgi:hypothetical protein